MSSGISFRIETHYDNINLIHHWDWVITTHSAIVRNRRAIKKDKNQAYASLERHVKSLFGKKIDRLKVKNWAFDCHGNRFPEKE
jgi:hypothetical protein